jgi:RNA polymerase sigma-54 factor
MTTLDMRMAGMEIRGEQRQVQRASPRLQHAVRLLQMSSLEFAALVRNSLNDNPFLEADEAGEADDADDAADGAAAPDEADSTYGDQQDAADGDDRDLWLADSGTRTRQADDDEFSALDTLPVETTLGAHLHGQLNLLPLQPRDRVLAHALVDSLDDDGYLRSPLDELAQTTALTPAPSPVELQIALRHVQALDPAGVGARCVAECLRLQLPSIDCPQVRALAQRIIDEQLPALAAHDSRRLGKALDASTARIEAACAAIRRLDPHPGWRFGSSRIDYVVPDVIVRKQRGEWQVRLNPAVVPRVRLNQVYAALFKRHREAHHDTLAGHLQEARWTMHNVEQRFSTILEVAGAIVRRQRHFLEYGALAMKPLGLREIADEVGVHESTVSRVTHHKYMATPTGVFELKHFFSRTMLSASGRACSGTAIRALVEELIQRESPAAPLSDAEIARQLAQQGLVVARRTVTKYRQSLHIEAVELRRRRQAAAA